MGRKVTKIAAAIALMADKVSPADARKAGRAACGKPTPQNSSMPFFAPDAS